MEEDFASSIPSMGRKDRPKPNLMEQNLDKIGKENLSPLTPEVISRQATINIGTIGHVAHGKSTVVNAISGVKTIRFRREMIRNITIKLGYANAKIFKCPTCPRPQCYAAFSSSKEDNPPCTVSGCESRMELQRHVSFVDCFAPGTQIMLSDGSSKAVERIAKDDKVMGDDGTPRKVLNLHSGSKALYTVTPVNRVKNGAEPVGFTCSRDHVMTLTMDTPVKPVCHDSAGAEYFFEVATENEEGLLYWKKHSFTYGNTANRTGENTTRCFDQEEAEERANTKYKEYQEYNEAHVFLYEAPLSTVLRLSNSMRSELRLFQSGKLSFSEDPATSQFVDMIECLYTELLSDADSMDRLSPEEACWFIGLWLGRGCTDPMEIMVDREKDSDVIDKLTTIGKKVGLSTHVLEDTRLDPPSARVKFTSRTDQESAACNLPDNVNEEDLLVQLLKKLGIFDNKHIPKTLYKTSVNCRMALVAGLIDSDGDLENNEEASFSLSQSSDHKCIAEGFLWIVRSLGFNASIAFHGPRYRVIVSGNIDRIPVALRRKKAPASSMTPGMNSTPFVVETAGVGPYYGFTTDKNQRFLLPDFTVVHNCPGHDILMATMLNGAAVMDAALLLIAGNEPCPQPQTSEHLAAVEIMKLENIIILQNKIDLVKESEAQAQYKDIRRFIQGTIADKSPIIPISAQLKYNIDVISEYITKHIPVPVRDFSSSPRLIVIRSFDVNKPGDEIDDLKGGVAGGSILQGVIRVDQEIEVRPGIVSKSPEGEIVCRPIFSHVNSLFAEENELQYAVPGGLIGVGTKIDPTLTRADRLVGQVLGEVGKLPDIYTELEISFYLLRRLLGVKSADSEKAGKVQKLMPQEILMINIGSTSIGGRVVAVKQSLAKIVLTAPVCTEVGEKLALSRRVDKHWRLIGWGQIVRGHRIEPQN
eukprot:gb/GECH01012084.1/.p1 GENE.gb/GECH01012084.1/~~gb/GECH01012084.1/.p1  ORF type:complete len:927 (+),score=156.59 gb/GECH01012084.1/:1-2781(+)